MCMRIRETHRMKSVHNKGCYNYGSGQNSSVSTSSFEFHKGNIASKGSSLSRTVLGSLKKPTPSKWDDAQKWVSGLSNGGDLGDATTKPRPSDAEDRRLIVPVPQKDNDYCSSGEEAGGGDQKIINEDEGETKKIDCNDSFWRSNKPLEDSLPAMRSVCLRDTGTEMTPIASQEPSRTGTPIRATTPALRSPISSRSSTPGRCHQGTQARESYQTGLKSFENRNGTVLFGGTNSTQWPMKEREDPYACKIFGNNVEEAGKPNSLETRAMAWDEAERAKYMARYKREEVKIQAWEDHEKRKAEKEMRRLEVKAERLKSRSQERLANKLAATRRRAEEKRASAEAKLNERAARTSERADYIRSTGHLPSSFFHFKLPSFCW